MAYNTSYYLMISASSPTMGDVAHELAKLSTIDPDLQANKIVIDYWGFVISGEPAPWYDHETHMRQVSAQWPGVVFTLHGVGEDMTDQWVEYYLDGKMQREVRPIWEPPELDKALLT